MQISVIGGSCATEKQEIIACQLGQLLGKEGFTVITGGGKGVMEAVCKGVKLSGGITVAILKEGNAKFCNSYSDIKICTSSGDARNFSVVLSSDIIIAIGGMEGTLSEICIALKNNRTVICIDSWNIPELKTINVQDHNEAIEVLKSLIN